MTGTPIPNVPIPDGKGKRNTALKNNQNEQMYQFPMGEVMVMIHNVSSWAYQSPMGKVKREYGDIS